MLIKNDIKKEAVTISIDPINRLILELYANDEHRSFSGTVNMVLANFVEEKKLKDKYSNLIKGV